MAALGSLPASRGVLLVGHSGATAILPAAGERPPRWTAKSASGSGASTLTRRRRIDPDVGSWRMLVPGSLGSLTLPVSADSAEESREVHYSEPGMIAS